MPKKVLIALPPAMLDKVDHIAEEEHRTRSDLIREALRRYIDGYNYKQNTQHPPVMLQAPQPVQIAPPTALLPRAIAADIAEDVADEEAAEIEAEPTSPVKAPIGFQSNIERERHPIIGGTDSFFTNRIPGGNYGV